MGLERFTRVSATPEGLARFLRSPERARSRVCEMCTADIDEHHQHVVDLESRNLLCTCRACYLLFTHEGAAQGRYKAVPERLLHDPNPVLDEAVWEELQVPVRIAFFFFNSQLGRVAGFYPSPAGATESLLPLHAWDSLVEANPMFAAIEPDVEAILLERSQDKSEAFLVPIDVCYGLVGLMRLKWKGFDGGEDAHSAIDAFLTGLRSRSRSWQELSS